MRDWEMMWMEEFGFCILVGKFYVDCGKVGKSVGGVSGGDGLWFMIRYIILFGNIGKVVCMYWSGISYMFVFVNFDICVGVLCGFV